MGRSSFHFKVCIIVIFEFKIFSDWFVTKTVMRLFDWIKFEDLFDISFLEHLTVLDLEGNNIRSLDQLCYLKPLTKLTDVNLKQNPVKKSDPD